MAYEDLTLTCQECSNAFTFSARDQEFYASQGYQNQPKRCSACRQARRSKRAGDEPVAERQAQPRRSAAPTVYVGVCAGCGGEAALPFEPIGNRPVLCDSCYARIRAVAR